MSDTEIIQGEDLLRLFRDLQKNKTVIRINILGRSYERLTMVIGVLNRTPPRYFRIDYPKGFERAVRDTSAWRMRFEFKGKDKIVYHFRTYGGYLSGKDIFIPFPHHIDRIQRRRCFRLDAPLGAKMVVARYAEKYEMTLLNLSEGGALVGLGKGSSRQPVFQEGDSLRHLVVLFQAEEALFRIPIEKALVKRLDKNPLTLRYQYALQFINLGPGERNDLRELIYLFQRDFLKKRQKVEG
jgi:c-di-GMP-binding flagellar brake protein YcgR